MSISVLPAVYVQAKVFLATTLHLMEDPSCHLLQMFSLLEQFIFFFAFIINCTIYYSGIFLLHFFAFLSDFDWGVATCGLSILWWLKWSSTTRLVGEPWWSLFNLGWFLLALILSVNLVLLAWCDTSHLLFIVIEEGRLHWFVSIDFHRIFIIHLLITSVGGWGVDLVSVLVALIIWLIVHWISIGKK